MDIVTLKNLIARVRERTPGHRIILFGSTSLFASFPDVAPAEICVELTTDADFLFDPDDEELRRRLLSELGKDTPFHSETGHFGDFVEERITGWFPPGWRERVVPMPGFDDVWALDPADMAASKILATARARLARRMGTADAPQRGMKDVNTVAALFQTGRITPATIEARLHAMDLAPALTVEAGTVLKECRTLAQAT